MKTRYAFLAALGLLVGAKALLAGWDILTGGNPWDFLRPVDDAYITYRYVANLAAGHGLVYNIGERVEGGTSVAMILLLTPFRLLGITRIPMVAMLMSLFAAAGIATLSWRFMSREGGGVLNRAQIFVFAFLSFGITSLVWAWAGMEPTLLALAVLAAVLRHNDESSEMRWPFVSALLTVAAGLLHPEGILVAVVLGLSWLFPWRKERVARGVAYGAVVVALFGGYWLWRWRYFGQLMPNTYYAKVGGAGTALIAEGITYLRVAWVATLVPLLLIGRAVAVRFGYADGRAWKVALTVVALLAPFLFVPSIWTLVVMLGVAALIVASWRRIADQPRWVWLMGGVVLIYTPYLIKIGGDFYPFHRFFVVLLAPIALLFWQADRGTSRVVDKSGRGLVKPIAIAVAVVFAMNVWSYVYTFQGFIHRELQRVVVNFAKAGEAMHDALPPDATIATLPIGAVGYYSERPIHDMMGLVERHIARIPIDMNKGVIGHQKYDHAYTLSQRPEAIIVLPSLYKRTPDGLNLWIEENALEPVQYRIYRQPALKREYRLAFCPVERDRGVYGFLRKDLVGTSGYEKWEPLGKEARTAAYGTVARAANHPLRGRSFGIWSFK
ncbi:MAG: hypothetical protein H6685_10350 [Deltaproteobacteria bacterium]|nr:hypothetical protein [Deltaproteobacteria bacterium]